jgi:hypothetical protein
MLRYNLDVVSESKERIMQQMFSPVSFGWTWTDNGAWYDWDRQAAHKLALKARNARVKELRTQGYKVVPFTLANQLVSKGGIGSGKAHIEQVVSIYGLNAYAQEAA